MMIKAQRDWKAAYDELRRAAVDVVATAPLVPDQLPLFNQSVDHLCEVLFPEER
jgi:hypothetical protein